MSLAALMSMPRALLQLAFDFAAPALERKPEHKPGHRPHAAPVVKVPEAAAPGPAPVPGCASRPLGGAGRPVASAPTDPMLRFAHPLANREATLGPCVVAFQFRRGRRRTIGFVVGAQGLVVSAPRWVPLSEVDAALREKSSWIVRKLQETRDRAERVSQTRVVWADGQSLPYLGGQLRLQIDSSLPQARAGAVLCESVDGAPPVLRLALPQQASEAQIRDCVQAWLMREARTLFVQRLDHYAPQLGVQWTRLTLSNAGTRWGSARCDGAIRLNWRLIHFGLPVIDYVVAHELSHLRVMDHSPRFWETVQALIPDYQLQRRHLREQVLPGW